MSKEKVIREIPDDLYEMIKEHIDSKYGKHLKKGHSPKTIWEHPVTTKKHVAIKAHEDNSPNTATFYEKYSYMQHGTRLWNKDKLKKIIDSISTKTSNLHWYERDGEHTFYVEDDNMLFIFNTETYQKWVSIQVYGNDLEKLNTIASGMNKKIEKINSKYSKHKIRLTKYFIAPDGSIGTNVVEFTRSDLDDLDPMYYDVQIDSDSLFKTFSQAKEKIIALFGVPGTGKSKLAKSYMTYLLDSMPEINISHSGNDKFINVGLMNDEALLSMESFWESIEYDDLSLLIMDDVDSALDSRQRSVGSELDKRQNDAMGYFLSYVDGTIAHNTKFIITTNTPSMDFDPAILRTGRTFACFSLDPLPLKQAQKIWKKYGLSKDTFPFEDDTVLQSDLGSKIVSYTANEGEEPPSFFRDGSNKFIRLESNKIGFGQ